MSGWTVWGRILALALAVPRLGAMPGLPSLRPQVLLSRVGLQSFRLLSVAVWAVLREQRSSNDRVGTCCCFEPGPVLPAGWLEALPPGPSAREPQMPGPDGPQATSADNPMAGTRHPAHFRKATRAREAAPPTMPLGVRNGPKGSWETPQEPPPWPVASCSFDLLANGWPPLPPTDGPTAGPAGHSRQALVLRADGFNTLDEPTCAAITRRLPPPACPALTV